MQPLRRSEFWEDTIKEAGRRAGPRVIKRAYRPVGLLIVVSFLVFMEVSRMTSSFPAALLITILVALLIVMFS